MIFVFWELVDHERLEATLYKVMAHAEQDDVDQGRITRLRRQHHCRSDRAQDCGKNQVP